MKFIRILVLTIFLLTNYLSKCQEKNDEMIVHDTLIKISLYEQFEINLEAYMSAGYTWLKEPLDSATFILIDSTSIVKYPQYPNGSPKIISYTFQGIQKGEYQLVFYYKRPWLDDIERKQYYTILIE
jgi:predicted secreted protein